MLSSLASSLAAWLLHPEVHVVLTSSDEVLSLRAQVDSLKEEVASLDAKATRAEALYGQECFINLTLEDELRSLGWRRRR